MIPIPPQFPLTIILAAAVLGISACGPGDLEATPSEDVTPEEIGHAESELLYGILAGSTVRATDNVYLRTGPAITYPSIRLVSSGERATVVQESSSGGFYKLDVGGTIGWSHGDYWELVPRLYVNGYLLTPNQEKWLRWVAAKTVPRLTGTRAERVNKVAWVAWWAMKEGVWGYEFQQPNPQSHSVCALNGENVKLGPLQTCNNGGGAWQVGLAAGQVNPSSNTVAALESTAKMLYPGQTIAQIMDHTANVAGFADGTTTYNGIVNSTGDLRKSWLLRNHGVGFHYQYPVVYSDCYQQGLYWCYGSSQNWYPAYQFASSRQAMLSSQYNIWQHVNNLAP